MAAGGKRYRIFKGSRIRNTAFQRSVKILRAWCTYLVLQSNTVKCVSSRILYILSNAIVCRHLWSNCRVQ